MVKTTSGNFDCSCTFVVLKTVLTAVTTATDFVTESDSKCPNIAITWYVICIPNVIKVSGQSYPTARESFCTHLLQ